MKINNLLLIGTFFFILCCFPFIELQANELKPTDTIEYFDDGSYYEITLQEDLNIFRSSKYSLQGTTQGRYLTGGVPPVRFSM